MKPSIPVESEVPPLLKRLKEVIQEAGLERLVSFPVVNCLDAYGVVLQRESMPSERQYQGGRLCTLVTPDHARNLLEASRGVTILIHKANFENCMMGETIAKNHSTTKEAIEVGDSAGAHYVILTHLSHRYPKIPALNEIGLKKTCIAFDLMSINITDLPLLPRILLYLELLFRKDMIIENSDDVIDATA